MEEPAMKSRKNSAMSDPVDAAQLFEHLQAVIRDSDALLKASASYAGDKIDQARTQAAESLAAAKERLADIQAGVVGQTREYVQKGDQYVRDNPWQSVGFAALAGFVLGALLLRSRD
ncbi:MAG: YqjD family protein [Steroidobacteraceae bacterium]|jgi:ElaB/YqjD/DUF883 family membrane-anchored ribosome-binding protein